MGTRAAALSLVAVASMLSLQACVSTISRLPEPQSKSATPDPYMVPVEGVRSLQSLPTLKPSMATPQSVALLLPAAGASAHVASVLRDGYFWAYFDSPDPRPIVRVYDSGSGRRSALEAYDRAVAAGAQLVIGPMLKEQVQALMDMRTVEVPTLALNFVDAGFGHSLPFYQISLAPEDEARQAAASAIAEGLTRSLALVENSAWGSRVLAAFVEHYRDLGGEVVSARTFPDGARDFAAEIRDLTGIAASNERNRALSKVLGQRLIFEPNRGHDADMVFVAADADATRMIMPELRFYHARHLPVYGTAAVYDRPISSTNRNGLRFCDAPLATPQSDSFVELRANIRGAHLSPADARVFALGNDAYRVGLAIASQGLGPGGQLAGASGHLVMAADGVVRRTLDCAEIAHGELRSIPEPLSVSVPN